MRAKLETYCEFLYFVTAMRLLLFAARSKTERAAIACLNVADGHVGFGSGVHGNQAACGGNPGRQPAAAGRPCD